MLARFPAATTAATSASASASPVTTAVSDLKSTVADVTPSTASSAFVTCAGGGGWVTPRTWIRTDDRGTLMDLPRSPSVVT